MSCGCNSSSCSSCGSVILPVSTGVVGPTGPAGPAGPAGDDGTVIYYSAASGPSGGNPGEFWVRDDNNELWYNDGGTWTLVWTVGGTTTTGAFTSGSGAPTGSATTGDVYLDITTDIFYKYTGSSWVIIPASYSITAWQTPALTADYGFGSPAFRYRQRGGIVEFKGRVAGVSPSFINVQEIIHNLPAGYRPAEEKYATVLDVTGGILGILKIETGGDVIVMGDLIPINTNELVLDTVLFALS